MGINISLFYEINYRENQNVFKESESGDISRSGANCYWICSLITSSSSSLFAREPLYDDSTIDRYKKLCRELNWRHDRTRGWGEAASCVFVLKVNEAYNYSTTNYYTHRQCSNYCRREMAWDEWITCDSSGKRTTLWLKLWLYRDLNQLLSHMLYKYGVILLQSLFGVVSGNVRFLTSWSQKRGFFTKVPPPSI